MLLRPNALAANEYDLLIYGQIGESWWDEESVTAKSVVEQLSALPDTITQINVRINSIGGSVHDGLAIYNALVDHPATIAVAVDGVAMSAASFIAMAGDTVNTPATSIWMIHGPSTYAGGNATELRAVAAALDVYASSMAPAYAAKSGKSVADIMTLLNDGADHYYTGEQAVEEGFADAVDETVVTEPEPVPAEARAAFRASVAGRLARAPADIQRLAIAAIGRPPSAPLAADNPLTVSRAEFPATPTGAINMPNETITANPADPAADAAAITAQAHAALRTRNAEITAMVQPHLQRDGVQAIYTAALADPTITVDAVRQQVLDKIGTQTAPLAFGSVVVGADETDKFRAAGENAILARAGYVKADGQNTLRGMSLREIARACADRAGKNTRGMDIREVVATAFTSTSDFPALLTSTARTALLKGYEEAPESFPLFTRAGTLTDFRPAANAGLGFFSALDKIPEGGEYKYGTFGAANNSIVLATYGKLFAITRQAIINDDLNAFTLVPRKMGRAAKRTIGDLVFAILTGNPTLADTVALFHATHKNLLTGSVIDTANVDKMRVAMATQKFDGQPINVPLKYLLVPKALEGSANTVRVSQYAVTDTANTTVPNTVANTFEVIADARLDGSPKVWFGSADPNLYDTIEVAYLDGVQEPFLDQKDGWNVDGTEFKVRIDAGVAPLDFRGLAKNPGA
jgi:ATP-dependent protease ClpP protease subunit